MPWEVSVGVHLEVLCDLFLGPWEVSVGVHWVVVGGLLGVSKGYKNHELIGPGGYWRGLKVFP
jgi:hypothetical protein